MDQQTLKQLRLAHLGFGVNQDPQAALARTIGIQAQQASEADLNLSLRTQTDISTVRDWYNQVPVVRSWAQRWTHQLLTFADWRLVISARQTETLPKTYFLGHTNLVRQLAAIVQRRLETQPQLTKDDVVALLTPLLPTDVKPTNFIYAVLQSLVAQGRLYFDARSSTQKYVIVANNLPLLPATEALPQLIKRYIEGLGPVSLADFCKWSGIRVTQVRPAWRQQVAELPHVIVAGTELVMAPNTAVNVTQPECQLAARFDACFTGYADKNWLIEPKYQSIMWTKNGLIMAPVLLHGNVIGYWQHRQTRTGVTVTVKHWRKLTHQEQQLVQDRLAMAVQQVFSLPVTQINFELIA